MKNREFNFDTTIDTGFGERDVTVYFLFSPGRKAVLYPNDLASPEEYPEAEVYQVLYDDGEDLYDFLDDEELASLEEQALEYIDSLDEEAA